VDTFGSDYDTVLTAYTGTDPTALTEVACNDQSSGGNQSLIVFPVSAGVTYSIEVSSFFSGGGNLVLNARLMIPGAGCDVPTNLLVNCGFEAGNFTGWVTSDLATPFFALTVGPAGQSPGFGFFTSNPSEGFLAALHGFDGDPGTIQIGQDVQLPTLPAGGLPIQLTFDYRGAWNLTFGATQNRTFEVRIEPSGGGSPRQTFPVLVAFAGEVMTDTGPRSQTLDLSAFAGQAVRVNFVWTIPESFTGPAFFQLDNVVLTGPSVLTVAKAGTGAGTVTSVPVGIDCGTDCSEAYSRGTVVTLTAQPSPGSFFAGWTGTGCAGTGPCVVTMTTDITVTATFNLTPLGQAVLSVASTGGGSGSVTSVPVGIDCGVDCTEAYPIGTVVTLTAVAASGSFFAGWSGGGCGGTGLCTVTLSTDVTVTASFVPALQIITPVDNTLVVAGTVLTVQWTAIPGVSVYFFEFTGTNRAFANPNGTVPDGVNGFGGAGGGLLVFSSSLSVTIPPGTAPGLYQIRVAAMLSGQIVGGFSDAVTIRVTASTTGSCGPVQPPVSGPSAITAPIDGAVLDAGTSVVVQFTPFGTNPLQCYFFEFTDPFQVFTSFNSLDVGAGGGVLVVRGESVQIPIPATTPPGPRQIRVAPVSGNPLAGPSDRDALAIPNNFGPAFGAAVTVIIRPPLAGQPNAAAAAPDPASQIRVKRGTSNPVQSAYPPIQAPPGRRVR
jgi:hypothetical protein